MRGLACLLLLLRWTVADLRNDLLPQCKKFELQVDKTECRQHYFIFIIVMLFEDRDEISRHFHITQQILTPCANLEKDTSDGQSFVIFADHNYKIQDPAFYNLSVILDDTSASSGLFDYIVVSKDVSSTKELQALMDGVNAKMRGTALDVQWAFIMLLGAPDADVTQTYGDSLVDFAKDRINNFIDTKTIARLIFTGDDAPQLSTIEFLSGLRDASKGYFDFAINKMDNDEQVRQKYGMCTDYKDPEQKSRSPLALWVPLAAVGGTFLLIIVTCVFLAWFGILNAPARRLHDFLETKLNLTVNFLDVEDGENMFGSAGRIKKVNDEWEVDQLTLHVSTNKLGSGAYASVFLSTLSGFPPVVKIHPKQIDANSLFTDADNSVAVKIPHVHISPQERREFFREIAFMKTLDYHPHLLCMLGCSTDPKTPMILLELCDMGDLHTMVKKMGELVDKQSDDDLEKAKLLIKLDDLVLIAWQISDGLAYLVSKNIIHRDIAARNVLLTKFKVAKISDFGLCRQSDEMWYSSRGGKLPLRWMAPESIEMAAFSAATDIWSYGVLLWEAYTYGTVPFPTVATEDVLNHLKEGRRLEPPDNCPQFMAELMQQCWEFDPSHRPTADGARMILWDHLEEQDGILGYAEEVHDETTAENEHETTKHEAKKSRESGDDEDEDVEDNTITYF